MRSKRRTMSSNSQSRSRWPFGGKSAGHESSDEEIEVSDTSSRQSSPQRSAEMADSGRDMRTMRSIRSRADNRASMLVDNRASMVIDDASSIVFFDDDDRGIVEMQFKFPDTMARDDMVRLISDLQAETFRNDDGDFY